MIENSILDVSKKYAEINKKIWNSVTTRHVNENFCNLNEFVNQGITLNHIELELLGDLKNKTVLQLQCHFGMDTLSLARCGAKPTGVDLSDKAISKAKELNNELGLNAEFICCNVYDLPEHLDKKFDIVFSNFGTIIWLPDLYKWAEVIYQFLKPGRKFILVELHPVEWMFDDDFLKIEFSYFNKGPIIETVLEYYSDEKSPKEVTWGHSLSEVIGCLMKNDLELTDFREYEYSPCNGGSGYEKIGENNYHLENKDLSGKIPLLYSIVAKKKTKMK